MELPSDQHLNVSKCLGENSPDESSKKTDLYEIFNVSSIGAIYIHQHSQFPPWTQSTFSQSSHKDWFCEM